IPVGNAGNISAYWKGFKEHNEKKQTNLPKIYGFEAELSAAITKNKIINEPETIATAIRIGNPASWNLATAARDESNGMIEFVSAEPGSCASIAGVFQQVKAGTIPQGSKVVAVLTGNGLKDPQTAVDQIDVEITSLPNDEEAVTNYIKNKVES